VDAVVLTVRVPATAAVPVTLTAEVTAHVGAVIPAGGLTREQARATEPVKPLEGVIASAEVLPLVAPGAMLIEGPEMVKDGIAAAATATLTAPDSVSAGEVDVPVTKKA